MDDGDGQEESSTIGSGLSCSSPPVMDISRKSEEKKGSLSHNASLGDVNERSKTSSDSSKFNKEGVQLKQRTSQRPKKPINIEDLGYVEKEKKFKVIKTTPVSERRVAEQSQDPLQIPESVS